MREGCPGRKGAQALQHGLLGAAPVTLQHQAEGAPSLPSFSQRRKADLQLRRGETGKEKELIATVHWQISSQGPGQREKLSSWRKGQTWGGEVGTAGLELGK